MGWGFQFVALFDYDPKGKECCKDSEKRLGVSYSLRFADAISKAGQITQGTADNLKQSCRPSNPMHIGKQNDAD